jgi:glycosyltransferase involved in cell wall biosynthesis
MPANKPHVGFVIEQTLGHVTYAKNLQTAFARSPRLRATWLPVRYQGGALDRVPGVSRNWTVRGSLRAGAAVRGHGGPGAFDALFVHTQTVGLLAPFAARRTPVILSLDATPLNFDEVGIHYNHVAHAGSRVERIKLALHRRMLTSASALTTWSHWAKRSLAEDYGIDPGLITVVPPGIDLTLFTGPAPSRATAGPGPVRVLFVGGDFERKGGMELLAALRGGLLGTCELHLVTRRPVRAEPGIHVYTDLGPNDPRLLDLYRTADIFALPTHADCLAVVLGEAMAAGLPVVTTTVGGQPEAVSDGVNGLLVPPGNVSALGQALARLAADPDLRRRMGQAGRAEAEARFDAHLNARRLADLIDEGIGRWSRARNRPVAAHQYTPTR